MWTQENRHATALSRGAGRHRATGRLGRRRRWPTPTRASPSGTRPSPCRPGSTTWSGGSRWTRRSRCCTSTSRPSPGSAIAAFKTGTEALHGVAWSNDAATAVVRWSPPTAPPSRRRPAWPAPGTRSCSSGSAPRSATRRAASTRRTRRCSGSTSGRRWSTRCATRAGAATRRATPRTRYLTGAVATAYGKGLQGADPAHLKTAPTLKHYLAYNNESAPRHHLVERAATGCSTNMTGRSSGRPWRRTRRPG